MKPYFEIRDFTQTPLCAEYIEKCHPWAAMVGKEGSCRWKDVCFCTLNQQYAYVNQMHTFADAYSFKY